MMSPTDKGVWIDLLCVMMMSEPYGHLSVNGVAMTDEQASRLIGTDIATYKGSIASLTAAGIPSFTDTGMMFSRRLVRDNARFVAASEAGHKGGGNPKLKKKLEAIDQKPEATQPIKVPFIDTIKGCDTGKLYGELQKVRLTADEHAKLTHTHGAAKLAQGIDILDAYIASSGKRYKSHYAVLKPSGWVWERVAQGGALPAQGSGGQNRLAAPFQRVQAAPEPPRLYTGDEIDRMMAADAAKKAGAR
jgi:hypothetical protein